MSGEGMLASVPGYEPWGFSSGTYPVNCIDCPSEQRNEDKIFGSVSSIRCLYHAIQARCNEQDEGCNPQLTFYEPTRIDLEPSCSWQSIAEEIGVWILIMSIALIVIGLWRFSGIEPPGLP